jgi:hypothetical protein
MRFDEPFPLEAISPRLRIAILTAFQGRRPSIGEVAQVPDKQWLSTPNVGERSVALIHDITDPARQQVAYPPGAQLTDAELLERLEWLQKELRWLQSILKSGILKT